MSISISEAAARHVTRYIAKRGKGVGVRLGVKTTGCSGLAYKLEYADEIAPEDVVFEDNGVKVLVDPKSLAYIDGTQLDFVREGLNEGFRFNNPTSATVAVAARASGSERGLPPTSRQPADGFFLMTMNLLSTDFEIFGLEPLQQLDRAALDARWKDLQREAHPDRFASADAQAQRQAMQWSVRINEAYQRLKDPLQRAAYLCELHGAAVGAENNTAMPPAFLMQQMEWREELEAASGEAALERMADEVAAARQTMIKGLEQTADEQHDYAALAGQVRALMFVERFARDVESRLDQLGQ